MDWLLMSEEEASGEKIWVTNWKAECGDRFTMENSNRIHFKLGPGDQSKCGAEGSF